MANFGNQIAKFKKKATKNIGVVQRKTIMDMSGFIISETPVDTGRAKGNWIASIGSSDNSQSDKVDSSGFGNIGSASISLLRSTTLKLKGDQTFYLSNNLPYIRALEYGHSPQNSGFVRLAVQRFGAIAAAAAKQVDQ